MSSYISEVREYQENLYDKHIGIDARDYLKKRQITPETARAWKIGFSPIGFVPQCYNNYTGTTKFWEKLNGRITFPVYNSNGEIVSISGRSIYDEIKPKYIHYQFPTRKNLFGLYNNIVKILEANAIIFVEGQLDVISAWQHGLRICASTMGAHFLFDQIILASRYTNRVFLLYDNDDAGEKGMMDSMKKLKTRGDMEVRKLSGILRQGEDVDDWVRQNDINIILNRIKPVSEIDKLRFALQFVK